MIPNPKLGSYLMEGHHQQWSIRSAILGCSGRSRTLMGGHLHEGAGSALLLALLPHDYVADPAVPLKDV